METNVVTGIDPGLSIPVLNLLPHSWQGPVAIAAFVGPYLTRYAYAFAAGRGIVGSIHAVLFGTNALPAAPAAPVAGVAIMPAVEPPKVP